MAQLLWITRRKPRNTGKILSTVATEFSTGIHRRGGETEIVDN